MSDGDQENPDFVHRFTLLETRAKKIRRTSFATTVVLIVITGVLVLRFAKDIMDKQAELQRVDGQRVELDGRLRSEQEKLDAATEARRKLQAEVEQLEKTKKSYQEKILAEKRVDEPSGAGAALVDAVGQTAASPLATTQRPPESDDVEVVESLLIEEEGKAPSGFVMTPKVEVVPGRGSSGRDIYKVRLWLEVPQGQQSDIERVTYHLSPKHYQLKRLVEGGAAPSFEARFNVFLCESTVLARAQLKNGATVAVDFDWCRHAGWPERKKEVVFLSTEEEKLPTTTHTLPQRSPGTGITVPRR